MKKEFSKFKQPEEFFSYLKEEFGLSIFSNAQRCLAIMLDMFEGDKQVTFLIKTAFNNKVYETLLIAKDSTSENKLSCIEKAIKILTDNFATDKEKASWVVSFVANIIYPNEWNTFLNKSTLKKEEPESIASEPKPIIPIQEKQTENEDEKNNNKETIFKKASDFISKSIKILIGDKNEIFDEIMNDMVDCPAGNFLMGSPKGFLLFGGWGTETGRQSDEFQHKVIISKPYKISKYPVTQKIFKSFWWRNPARFSGENNPVEYVSWFDAKDYCKKLNNKFANKLPKGYKFDLPTEAQWEYACRAGKFTAFNSGKELTSDTGYCANLDEVGWYSQNSSKTTHPVGQKKPNAWGIYDMHGNVWEWCNDLYDDYPSHLVTDPKGATDGKYRVVRGGSWDSEAQNCRSATRNNFEPDYFDNHIGFRLALVPVE